LPFSLVMRTIRPPRRASGSVTPALSQSIAVAVRTAARNMPGSLTCLPQGLAACWMLQGKGAAPRLHYGVQSAGNSGFRAHVWVELDGRGVLGHNSADSFSTLAVFPGVRTV
jgi:hypothetical protein